MHSESKCFKLNANVNAVCVTRSVVFLHKNPTMITPNKPAATTLEQRIIRFDDFIPCTTAFIDARTPGSDKKENFCLIGGGVTENPGQVVHINIPHGFDIGAARQPQGCKNSHHSHDTEEVFIVFSGDWKFTWGQEGEDGEVVLSAGATISIPTQVFRGFENVGADSGFMYAVLGLDKSGSAGQVIWAPYVFHKAKSHGLILLEDGRLIDTVAGVEVPDDAREYTPISQQRADSDFHRMNVAEMAACIANRDQLDSLASGGLTQLGGVTERAVIGCANPTENIGGGKMAWEHGFQVRHLSMRSGAQIPLHRRREEEVVIVQQGELTIDIDGRSATLAAGDVFTAPVDQPRRYHSQSQKPLEAFIVRRGNHPVAAEFL